MNNLQNRAAEANEREIRQIALLSLLLGGLGPILLFFGLPAVTNILTHSWARTQARVVRTQPLTYHTTHGVEVRDLRVHYEYVVESQRYSGAFRTKREAIDGANYVHSLDKGTTFDVYFARDAHGLSRRRPTPSINEWLTPTIGALFLLFGPALYWRRRRFATFVVQLEDRVIGL